MCVTATGAWYALRASTRRGRVMLHWGLGLAAVLIPVQLFFGHLTGRYCSSTSPRSSPRSRRRWQTSNPAD